jgi:hypothetical protein
MSKSEEVLYQALAEGIRERVLEMSDGLKQADKWMEIGDRLELALKLVQEQVIDEGPVAARNTKTARTLNQLRQVKTYGYRAPDDGEEFAPDAPGEEGEEVRAMLIVIDARLSAMEDKLDFILKYLEDSDNV